MDKETKPMNQLEYETCKRLWQMFFKSSWSDGRPLLDEAHGVAMVHDLLVQHGRLPKSE